MRILLTYIFVISFYEVQGQFPEYYVYLVTGNVSVIRSGNKSVPVLQNQFIFKSDIIVLKKNSDILLVDEHSNFLELNSPGTYNSTSLREKATITRSEGITSKYLKLLFHEFLDPTHEFEKFKEESLAGVYRTSNCNNRIFPIEDFKTSVTSINFIWHSTSSDSSYTLSLYKEDGSELNELHTNDTSMHYSLENSTGNVSIRYCWNVTSAMGNCEDEVPICFYIVTPTSELEMTSQCLLSLDLENTLQLLKGINNLEKQGFVFYASDLFASALKKNPGDFALRKSYVYFLLKYGFEDTALLFW